MANIDAPMADAAANNPPVHGVAPVTNAALMVQGPGTINPLSEPVSSYYLHPGESPGLSLVSALLTEGNYQSLSRSTVVPLDAKNKLGFIDGSLPEQPIGDPMKPA